jgi:hypothetical protein
MTDNNHRPTTEAVPLPHAQPYQADCGDSRHAEAYSGKRDPVLLDLEDVATRLRALGVRCRQGEDGLWVGKLCLHAHGEVSVDGRVRGLDPAHLGQGVEGFIEALQRIGMISRGPKQSAAGNEGRKRGYPWCRLHHRPSPRLKGKRAAVAVDRMCAFLDEHELSYEQLGPGRFLICRQVYYNPPSGRIRLKGSRTHPVKGFDALTKVLVEEANNPKLGHLYPQSLRQDDLAVLVTDDPLEKTWAGSIAARALAMAARSRPARGAVAQKG